MERLQLHFNQEDIREIMKIKTSKHNEQDFIAWQPEKHGLFSVKSAYRLALKEKMRSQDRGATSVRPDGERPCWKLIWNCPVPAKMKILAWKISHNALATKANLRHRGIATTARCDICGTEDEDTFHVFLRCPHARSLWLAMKEVWDLPSDELLQPTGPEWLLQTMCHITEDQRAMLLMTLWRIWHAHNEITHDKPCPPVEGSRRFLVSYLNSLLLIKQFPAVDIRKGKMVVNHERGFKKVPTREDGCQKVRKRWQPPEQGFAKLNVDGAFTTDGHAGAGMVLRDHRGHVIYTACRSLEHCSDATEAELRAFEEGVQLALHWSTLPFTVETDCVDVLLLLKEKNPNTSTHAFRVNAIRELLKEREIKCAKISRDINIVSHELALVGRIQC